MPPLEFTTTLEPRGPAAAVLLDDAQVAEVGEGAKAFPVRATINGFTWAGRVARMRGENMLGLTKATRTAAGVEPGDEVTVRIELDTAPREVEVPSELATALDADPALRARFDALAFTHRKEFVRWVQEAKREETRATRIAKTVDMVREGQTRN